MTHTCPFCHRPVAGECRRPSCRVRREYAERQRPLFIEPLDPDVSELPEPTKSKDDRYHVVWSGALHRRGLCPGLSSFPTAPEPKRQSLSRSQRTTATTESDMACLNPAGGPERQGLTNPPPSPTGNR
jgi:hypothetical protein